MLASVFIMFRPRSRSNAWIDLPAQRLVRSPRWNRLLTSLLTIILVVMVCGMIFVPWQQTAVGSGDVIAYQPLERRQTIDAPTKGRVTHWFVSEGDHVKRGDRLLKITDNDPELLDRLYRQEQLVVMQVMAYDEKIIDYNTKMEAEKTKLQNELEMIEAYITIIKDKVRSAQEVVRSERAARTFAKQNYERTKKLFKDGLEAEVKFQDTEMKYRMQQAKVANANAKLDAAKGELEVQEAKKRKATQDTASKIASIRADLRTAKAAKANADSKLQDIRVKISRQNTQNDITAPRDGTIFKLLVAQGGEQVKQGDPLLIFIPDTNDRAVELWVDGNDMPLIQHGQHVRLQFEGWPAVQFSGWPSVAIGTFGGLVDFVDATDNNKGKFRIVVVPDPDDPDPWPDEHYLRQGVRAKGWVMLAQVPIGFEIWRQLNGFPPLVTPVEDGGSDKSGPSKGGPAKTQGGKK